MPSYNPVYSAAFIQYTNSEPNVSFEVPSGFTAVVRQVTAFQEDVAALFQLFIQDSEEAEGLCVIGEYQDGIPSYYQWEGRVVVPAGGIMTVSYSALGSSPAIYVGGYLLTNVLP